MSKRQRISGVDTAWLRMDRPHNHMMITGVLILGTRLTHKRLARMLEDKLLVFRRFRQKAVQELSGAYWVDDDAFDIDNHVVRAQLHAKGAEDQVALERLVSGLMATPLDRGKPMWQYTLVERYGEGSAVIARIHHAIGDGIALIQVLLSLTEESRPRRAGKLRRDGEDEGWISFLGPSVAPLVKPLVRPVRKALRATESVVEEGIDLIRHPDRAADYWKRGVGFLQEAGRLVLMERDSATRFKGKPGEEKRVAWAKPFSLEEVKAVGKAFGCSINDVLCSCAAGALRGYLLSKGDSVDDVEIRALIPVNLRSAEKAIRDLGNYFGLVFLSLPVAVANPHERLLHTRFRMEQLKGGSQALVALGILNAMGIAPRAVQEQILQLLAANATAVMTNVPGPQHELSFAGSPIKQLMFWVPQSGDIGMGISILTYNGQVQFGVVTDAGLCPDPQEIIRRFEPEFEKLLYFALMMPEDTTGEPFNIEEALLRVLAFAQDKPEESAKPPRRAKRRAPAKRKPASPASAEEAPAPAVAAD